MSLENIVKYHQLMQDINAKLTLFWFPGTVGGGVKDKGPCSKLNDTKAGPVVSGMLLKMSQLWCWCWYLDYQQLHSQVGRN